MKISKIRKDWLDKYGLQIGSRALGVAVSNSDFDYVIDRNIFEDKVLPYTTVFDYITPVSSLNYWTVDPEDVIHLYVKVPMLDDEGITRECDILLTTTDKDFETIRKSIEELKSYPKAILRSKTCRVDIYERLLLSNGFKLNKDKYINRLAVDDDIMVIF